MKIVLNFIGLAALVFALGPTAAAGPALVGRSLYEPFFRDKGEDSEWVGPLAVDRTPITNAEFLDFVKKHPKWQRSQVPTILAQSGYLQHWDSDLSFEKSLAAHPVVQVSWFAARAYCKSLDKRLMTIAEWEVAADSQNPDHINKILKWYGEKSKELPAVGLGEANRYGIYDMHAVIWEWVEDFSSIIVSVDSRSKEEGDNALYCGGAAITAKDPSQYAIFMRFAFRSSLKGNYTTSSLGFRCVSDPAPTK